MATKKTTASKAVKATTTTAKADAKTEKVVTVATKATEKVTAPVKAEATKKVEKVAEKAPAKKTTAKKTTTKKTATKKTTTKTPTKKITEKTPSKRVPSAKKAEAPAKVETAVKVFVEYNGAKVALEDVINNVKIVNGKDAKEITVYLKPEDQKAYFVADGEAKEMDVFFC